MSTLTVATVKSNSSSPPAFQNTSGTEIGTLCRGWVSCNGNGSINGSFNCSSITDQGSGMYQFNFATSLPDKNYSVVGSCILGTTPGVNGITILAGSDFAGTTPGSQTSSYFRFGTYPNNSRADMDWVTVAVFR